MITVRELVDSTNGELLYGKLSKQCRGVSIDSRSIRKEEVFIALKGKNFDGHDFIKQALSKKACGFIYSKSIDKAMFFNNSKFAIKVEDTLYSLGEIARFHREKCNPKVIAVTGSAGKTTTKNLITEVLSNKFNTCRNYGTQNNLIGVPLNILRSDSFCQILILELGTNKPGEIFRLAEISKPDIGILLNIGPSHLKYLGSLKGIQKEKVSLFNNLKNQGQAVVNTDCLDVNNIKYDDIITFGIKKKADFKAENINFLSNGIRFWVNKIEFFMPFRSIEYLYNALACIAIAFIFGIDNEYLKKVISEFKNSISGRFQKIEFEDFLLINDSYNSNPLSVQCALNAISAFKKYKRRIFVFGDMLELGKYAKEYHYRMGKLIADSNINFLFIIGKFSEHVKKGALDKKMNKENIKIFKGIEQLYNELISLKRKDDLILVKASRAIALDKLVKDIKKEFG